VGPRAGHREGERHGEQHGGGRLPGAEQREHGDPGPGRPRMPQQPAIERPPTPRRRSRRH
jgi:hypothetical protein